MKIKKNTFCTLVLELFFPSTANCRKLKIQKNPKIDFPYCTVLYAWTLIIFRYIAVWTLFYFSLYPSLDNLLSFAIYKCRHSFIFRTISVCTLFYLLLYLSLDTIFYLSLYPSLDTLLSFAISQSGQICCGPEFIILQLRGPLADYINSVGRNIFHLNFISKPAPKPFT
jgi:hypothetical protein